MKTFSGEILQRACIAVVIAVMAAPGHSANRLDVQMVPMLKVSGDVGSTYQVQYSTDLSQPGQWQTLTNIVMADSSTVLVDFGAVGTERRFYQAEKAGTPTANGPVLSGLAFVGAGAFTMGDSFGEGIYGELPQHLVNVSAFYMERTEVTQALWDEVTQWAKLHGYDLSGVGYRKPYNHPMNAVSWYDALKWCNARSEMEGKVPAYYTNVNQTTVYRVGRVDLQNCWVNWRAGYRLPTEAEWEKAARGGADGRRFPWSDGDAISQSQANYFSFWSQVKPVYQYDLNPTEGYLLDDNSDRLPYTRPVGSFAPNGYGLHDMAGNVAEWCWDHYDRSYYDSSPKNNPRGSIWAWTAYKERALRGGSWAHSGNNCRVAARLYNSPLALDSSAGFRTVLPADPPSGDAVELPESAGKDYRLTIITGVHPFSAKGVYSISFSADAKSYQITGTTNIPSSGGTMKFEIVSDRVIKFLCLDQSMGPMTAVFTWGGMDTNHLTLGDYLITKDDAPGTFQSGAFREVKRQ